MTGQHPDLRSTIDYDAVADEWDRDLGFRSPTFAARMQELIVRLLKPAAGGKLALELGAGTGWMLEAIAPLFEEVHAIEPSARMRTLCQRRIAASGNSALRVEAGDALSLDGTDNESVDAIYAIGLLDAVDQPQRVLAAASRVLKPGGLLVVTTSNGACPWYACRDRVRGRRDIRSGRYLTAAELIAYATGVGLSTVEVLTWGAAPPRLRFAPAVATLNLMERIARRLNLSRYLGVLTASFRKPD